MSARKSYFLLSFVALVFLALFTTIIFIISPTGYLLIIPLALAVFFGLIAWVAFFAALSNKPNKMIKESIIEFILDQLLKHK